MYLRRKKEQKPPPPAKRGDRTYAPSDEEVHALFTRNMRVLREMRARQR